MNNGFAIAIDGPVASGKGTLAPKLAKKLNGFYLYTGAMYRGLALRCLEKEIAPTDTKNVIAEAADVSVSFINDRILLNGTDVTDRIKEADIAFPSSTVATIAQVRSILVQKQREIAEQAIQNGKIVIAEGRDTGTVLFPKAGLKVFLTARHEVRAKRRLLQLQKAGNTSITFDQVLADIKRRDEQDTNRVADPLVIDPGKFGYITIDNSDITEDETIVRILNELEKQKKKEND